MYGTRNPDGIQFAKTRVLGNTNTNTISNTFLPKMVEPLRTPTTEPRVLLHLSGRENKNKFSFQMTHSQ